MKTITLNSDNRSIILADDAVAVSLETDHVRKGDERIYGLPASDVTLHEGVSVPADWESSKYMFDGSVWSDNPDWVDPEADLIG